MIQAFDKLTWLVESAPGWMVGCSSWVVRATSGTEGVRIKDTEC